MTPTPDVFTDPDFTALGQRLRAARKAQTHPLSQSDLAAFAALDIKTISALERGKSTRVEVTTLYRVCRVLRCSMDEVLGIRG